MATSMTIKFTASAIEALPLPPKGERAVYRDPKKPGLELRVTSAGAKTFSVRQRIKGGGVERVTIGPFGTPPGGKSVELAWDKAREIVGVQATGERYSRVKRKNEAVDKVFAAALQDFLDDTTVRDNPLKDRTRSDYLLMIRPAGKSESGHSHGAGELASIANRKVSDLTGAQLKLLHKRLAERSTTRAGYAMRVVRAVLNYQGIRLEDDPFSAVTAKRDRIIIPAAKARSRTIRPEQLASWWHAASATQTGDAFQLLLLTGLRRGELSELRTKDADLEGARLYFHDTKNRKPHTVLLSKQALALVKARAANKAPDDLLFVGAADPRKSLQAIIDATGIPFSAHDCRRTFASIAAARLPGYVVKRLMNHASGGDVTAAHYVHLDEDTLRAAWQTVADAIVPPGPAATVTNIVSLAARRAAQANYR